MKSEHDKVRAAQDRIARAMPGYVDKKQVNKHLDQMRHHMKRSQDYIEFLSRDSQMSNWSNYESSCRDLRDELDHLLKLVQPGVRYNIESNVLIEADKKHGKVPTQPQID